MRLRKLAKTASAAAAALIVLGSSPAFAGEGRHGDSPYHDSRPEWRGDGRSDYPGGPPPGAYPDPRYDVQARDAWLADCRDRVSRNDRGLGGAAIGGVVGGLAGNRIAGRGNRTVGTVAGAAVGAVAGMAIDKAEDRGRNRDECEAYLDNHYANYYRSGPGYGYGQPAYGYGYGYAGYAVPMMMVPVQRMEPECTETVEYVYEDVPVRPRPQIRRPATKRVKVIPDKRVKVVPIK